MDTNNINIIVFDDKDNFERTKNLIGYEGDTVKRFFCIQSLYHFKNVLEQLGDDDLIILVVHVFGKTENLKGIAEFKASDIAEKYSRLEYMLVSEGNSQVNIQKSMLENSYDIKDVKNIYKYWQVRD